MILNTSFRRFGCVALAAGVIATALGACTKGNARNTIGSDLRLPALSDSPPRRETAIRDDSPSIAALSRPSWGVTPFVVPVDGVASKPIYTKTRVRTDETARQRAEYPTALTALDLAGDTRAVQWREAVASPFWSLYDLVAMPVRMYKRPPTEEVRGEMGWYARARPETPRSIAPAIPAASQDAVR